MEKKFLSTIIILVLMILNSNQNKGQEIVWEKYYSIDTLCQTYIDQYNNIKNLYVTPNNDFILLTLGDYLQNKNHSSNLMEIDKNGNNNWNKIIVDTNIKECVYFTINSKNEYVFINKNYYHFTDSLMHNCIYITKYDANGNLIYKTAMDSTSIGIHLRILFFFSNNDSTFNIIGEPLSNKKILLQQYDYTGRMLNQKIIDSVNDENSTIGIGDMSKTPDGFYLLWGRNNNDTSYNDIFYKIDGIGNIIYKFKTQISKNLAEMLLVYHCIQTIDGNIAILGIVQNKIDPPLDSISSIMYIQKIDTLGKRIFRKYYGNNLQDECNSMINTQDSGFAIAASKFINTGPNYTVRNDYLIKTDKDGNVQWEWILTDDVNEELRDVIETKEGDFVVAGNNYNWETKINNVNLIKIKNSNTNVNDAKLLNNTLLYSYPNPFSSSFNLEFSNNIASTITIELYNILGEKIYTNELGFLGSGTHTININPYFELNPGCYFICIISSTGKQWIKILKM